jgi:hypothetical protein
MNDAPKVVITQMGRGGGIAYLEQDQRIAFDFEFAMSPAIVLIWGPKRATWERDFPWASGRQEEIYAFVAESVVRQKASGGGYELDLDAGEITILSSGGVRSRRADLPRSPSYMRFTRAIPAAFDERVGQPYNPSLLLDMTDDEVADVIRTLSERDVTWREVAVFAAIDRDDARRALNAALHHHLSADTRLAAAEALDRTGGLPDFALTLAREIRLLSRPTHGLERALRLAAAHDSEPIRQALLWASYNRTPCAPLCATQLLRQSGTVTGELSAEDQTMIDTLGPHHSAFERDDAFTKLCARVGMTLDQSSVD